MKKILTFLCLILIGSGVFYSCQEPADMNADQISDDVLGKLVSLGFNIYDQKPIRFDAGYLVEGDIYLTGNDLATMGQGKRIANVEQYSTNNLVTSTPRVITVYIPEESSGGGKGSKGGSSGFSATYVAAVDEAISRYNGQNLTLSMQRVTSSNADIVFTRLAKGDERRGILGSAGFPTSSGDPYGEIKMSGVLESTYRLSVNGIATIMAHEMGHCIGFRHTDYFDRSISCGGGLSNEGDGGVGANHIPGTPTGATLQAKSWMLACTDGGDRPFNNDDRTALDYLY
ncbi:MAG TPA: M57 family metalloprotease [Cyclobacteriaceae bacterium]